MTRYPAMAAAAGALVWTLALAVFPGAAAADVITAPQVGAACAADLADAMTLLDDEQTYAACRDTGAGHAWSAVQTPFEPNDTWLSYGPPIILHGQGMRNPNLTSGPWNAVPLDPTSTCKAEQQTVVEAGVLSEPQVIEGEQGRPVSLQMPPKLFYVTLSGTCLWTRE